MKYLIMRCDELNDQYECDCDRTPITITNDWAVWHEKNNPDYSYEVYALKDGEFVLEKKYTDRLEEGMAFYYWPPEADILLDKPIVKQKWPNKTRYDSIPSLVQKFFEKHTNCDKNNIKFITGCGYISGADEDENFYVYGEYRDNWFVKGC